jgi:PPOX class probable F420-dependent enzyme
MVLRTRTKPNHREPETGSLRNVDPQEALDFIRSNHRAVLSTTRSDGGTQLSPVVVGVGDNGEVVVSTRETALKTKNLRARPRATLVAFTDSFFGRWVQVEGAVQIDSLPEAMDGLVAYYRQLAGEHSNWDEYRQAMTTERRVLLRIAVERAGPDISG